MAITAETSRTFEEILASQCDHGMYSQCRGSEIWETIGELSFKPNCGCFGANTYWFARCCGEAMARCIRVQTYKCTKCGRSEDKKESGPLALCLVCGKVQNMSVHDAGGPF